MKDELYGSKEDFKKALEDKGLSIDILRSIKEVELQQLYKAKIGYGKLYRNSEYLSDEEERYSEVLAKLSNEIEHVRDRIRHYTEW
jgi:hypothetical protein